MTDNIPTLPHEEHKPEKVRDFNDLGYWIGSVNTTLTFLVQSVERFIQEEAVKWKEFSKWRDTTNSRLAQGSEHLAEHDRRLDTVESNFKSLIADLRTHAKNKEIHMDEKVEKYISWPWVLDNILLPVLRLIIAAFVIYVIVNAVPLPF